MSMFPAPTVTVGSAILEFLRSPTRVTRALIDLTANYFLADALFAAGPAAPSGAIVYDQVTAVRAFLGDDVQVVRPGMEHPVLTEAQAQAIAVAIESYGGRVPITQQRINRGDTGAVDRALTQLANTITRKVDQRALAALAAAPTNSYVGTDWTAATAAAIIAQIIDAASLVNDAEAGYAATILAMHPTQANELLKLKDFRDALQQIGGEPLLRGGDLGEMVGLRFLRSNRITAGTAWIVAGNQAGSISNEEPLTTLVYFREEVRTWWVQGWRAAEPFVHDPLAAVEITGI